MAHNQSKQLFVRRLFLALLFVCVLITNGSAAAGATTVYITATGKKYHTSTCGYLSRSKIKTTLSDAVSDGYTACSRCNPLKLSAGSDSPVQSQDEITEDTVRKIVNDALEQQQEEIIKSQEIAMEEYRESIQATFFASSAIFGVVIVYFLVRRNRQKEETENKIACLNNQIEVLEKELIESSMHGLTCREKAGVPKAVLFDSKYYPVQIDGESCVVYYNTTSQKYHRRTCKYSNAANAVNVFRLPPYASPCQICKPPFSPQLPHWAIEYQRLIDQKKKASIDDPDIPNPKKPPLLEP